MCSPRIIALALAVITVVAMRDLADTAYVSNQSSNRDGYLEVKGPFHFDVLMFQRPQGCPPNCVPPPIPVKRLVDRGISANNLGILISPQQGSVHLKELFVQFHSGQGVV